jgi:cytochrome c-type biogenesis protein CcmH/NrfF
MEVQQSGLESSGEVLVNPRLTKVLHCVSCQNYNLCRSNEHKPVASDHYNGRNG